MDYNAYAEQLRQKISGYNDSAAEIEKRYKEALKENKNEYGDEISRLETALYENQNDTASELLKQKQSNDQILASRGLAHSGESDQSDQNSRIMLDSEIHDLERAYVDDTKAAAEKRKKADKSARESFEASRATVERQISEAKTKLAEADQKAYEQRSNEAAEIAKKEEAAHDRTESGKTDTAQSASGSSDKSLLTEKEMAKNIIAACCKDKSVKTETETARIRVMLESLKHEFGFDDKYGSDIMKLLASYGYVDMDLTEAEGKSTAATAAENLDRWTSEYYRTIRNSTMQPNLTAYENARKKAKQQQVEYVITHCSSLEAASLAMKELGYNYYDTRELLKEALDNGCRLGQYVNYSK